MYTTGEGIRKIRVINYQFMVTNQEDNVFNSADYLAYANVHKYIYLAYVSNAC